MCDCYSLLFTPYHMHARNISDVWCIIAECNSGCLMCACSVRIAGSLLCYTMLQRSALGVTLLYVVSMNKSVNLDFAAVIPRLVYAIPELAAARSRKLHYPDWRPSKSPFHDWRYADKYS